MKELDFLPDWYRADRNRKHRRRRHCILFGIITALVAGWVPQWWIPCGSGPSCSQQALVIFDDIQLPWLSLAAFVAITLTLTLYLQRTRT